MLALTHTRSPSVLLLALVALAFCVANAVAGGNGLRAAGKERDWRRLQDYLLYGPMSKKRWYAPPFQPFYTNRNKDFDDNGLSVLSSALGGRVRSPSWRLQNWLLSAGGGVDAQLDSLAAAAENGDVAAGDRSCAPPGGWCLADTWCCQPRTDQQAMAAYCRQRFGGAGVCVTLPAYI